MCTSRTSLYYTVTHVYILFAKIRQKVIKIKSDNDILTNIKVFCVFISFCLEQVFDYQL